MSDDHDEDRPAYNPNDPTAPARDPPLRSTAPQSDYNSAQIVTGLVIFAVGLALTFAVPFVIA